MAYGNLALKTSVEDVLGYKFPKELAQSDWAVDELSPDQVKCEHSLSTNIPDADYEQTQPKTQWHI
jgi:hypothetical protein